MLFNTLIGLFLLAVLVIMIINARKNIKEDRAIRDHEE